MTSLLSLYLSVLSLITLCATNGLQTLNAPNASLADGPGSFKCTPATFSRYSRRLARFKDCSMALHQFPKSLAEGTFHTGGVDDDFKLPRNVTVGTCCVRVELVGAEAASERYSWLGIGAAASQLALACHVSGVRGWKTGGVSTLGPRALLEIRMGRPPRWLGVGDGPGEERMDGGLVEEV